MNKDNHIFEFKYKHLLVQKIRQYDSNNEIKISSSYNNRLLALTLTGLDGYSTRDD